MQSALFVEGSLREPPWHAVVWLCEDHRHLTDLDFCRALKKSGCVMLKLGLESGDQGFLDQMKKSFAFGSLESYKNLRRRGFQPMSTSFLGPFKGLAEARQTLEFTAKHADGIDF